VVVERKHAGCEVSLLAYKTVSVVHAEDTELAQDNPQPVPGALVV